MLLPHLNLQVLLPASLAAKPLMWEQLSTLSDCGAIHVCRLLQLTTVASAACEGAFVLGTVRRTMKIKPLLSDTFYLGAELGSR